MKYSISGFRQEKALEFRLEYIDLGILRWLTDHYLTLEKMVIDKGIYVMVNYKMIIDDLPLLNLTVQDVSVRFAKLVKSEILGQYFLNLKRVLNPESLDPDAHFYFFGKNYELLLCD